MKDLIKREGIGFLIPWLAKKNIEKLLNQNFKHPESLDSPIYIDQYDYYLLGMPLGLSVHWIAGNVPVLGVISLFQTLLTKNKSIVKLPSAYKDVLPNLLFDLMNNEFFSSRISTTIKKLLENIILVYIDKSDNENQALLSTIADIRICWGGADAVESVTGLPKKINCRDLIFGPKISLAYVSSAKLESEDDVKDMAEKLANDIYAFDQTGCNAPHNLIIEKGSRFNLSYIAEAIEEVFEKKSRLNELTKEPIDTFNILLKEFIYNSQDTLEGKTSKTGNWNIFIRYDKPKLEEPLYGRSIFISEIESIDNLGNMLPSNIQSVGLFVPPQAKPLVMTELARYGVDRFPNLGSMSIYQNPWDGYLPMQSMVKWISSN